MKELIEQAAAEADEVFYAPKDEIELPAEAQAAIKAVEEAQFNYELCTIGQKHWVLKNCPERLFLDYGPTEKKLVRKTIREMEKWSADNMTIQDIFPTIH